MNKNNLANLNDISLVAQVVGVQKYDLPPSTQLVQNNQLLYGASFLNLTCWRQRTERRTRQDNVYKSLHKTLQTLKISQVSQHGFRIRAE